MSRISGFPKNLLDKTIDERIRYFNELIIGHPRLNEATQKAIKMINDPARPQIFMLIGPTGVGKSTLIKRVIETAVNESKLETEKNKGHIPIVATEVSSPDSGNFNWKDFYIRSLETLNEPLIDYKFDYDKLISKGNSLKFNRQGTASEFRRSLENALIYRKPAAFLLDEAQHFTKLSSGRNLQDQLDTLKSLANKTGVFHFLIGTYELVPMLYLNGQLSRRAKHISFFRYQYKENDLKEFKGVIRTFQKFLPLEKEPDLLEHWQLIYERTIGCIGILKDWLASCLSDALNNNMETIDYNLLREYAPSVLQAERMAIDAVKGEDDLKEDEEQERNLKATLGIISVDKEVENRKEKKSSKKVGQRKPVRDKAG